MEIIENRVYSLLGGKSSVRLLSADRELDQYWLIDLTVGSPFMVGRDFFSPTNLEGLAEDPFDTDFKDEALTKGELKIRDRRYESILPLVPDERLFNSVWRKQRIRELLQEEEYVKSTLSSNPTKSANTSATLKAVTIENALHQYWRGGMVRNALLPGFRNCGAPGKDKLYKGTKQSVSQETKELIKKGFWKYYCKKPKATLRQSRIDFMAAENIPSSQFTLGQWIWWGAKLNDALEVIKERVGKGRYDRDSRTNRGTARDGIFGPYSEVMIDSTIDNVRIIMIEVTDKYIGRLSVYFAVDVFSATIVGMYVSPQHPSYVVGSLCLVNMVEDKVEFCKRYGVNDVTSDQCVPNYLPRRLLADRGEFISNMSSSLTNNLKIDLSNTPSRRPDLKSYVELQFRLFQQNLKSLLDSAGYIDKHDEPRVTPDTRKQACLTLHDMVNLIIREVVHYNNFHWMDKYPRSKEMIRDNIRPIPLEILKWGIANGLGNPICKDKVTVWRNALPSEVCRVTKDQIQFKGHSFKPVDSGLRDMIDKLRFENKSCEISYNPMNFKQIYMRHGRELLPLVPIADSGYESFYEFDFVDQDLSEQKRIHEQAKDVAEIEKRKKQLPIVKEAQRRRSKKVEINNVRENRSVAIQQHAVEVMERVDPESALALSQQDLTTKSRNTSKSSLPSLIANK